MFHLKNKISLRIIVFAVVVSMCLWLMPAAQVFGEDAIPKSIEELQQAVTDATAALTDAQLAATEADAAVLEAEQALADAPTILADAQLEATEADAAVSEAEQILADALAAANQVNDTNTSYSESGVPNISTDKIDYHPEEVVIVEGVGLLPNTEYLIKITRPDGTVVVGDGSFDLGSDTITTSEKGEFTYKGNDVKEFQELNKQKMMEGGHSKFFAWLFTRGMKRLGRWKNK